MYELTKKECQALLAFASPDATRPHVCAIGFDGKHAVTTDGHTLCVLTKQGFPEDGEEFVVSRANIEIAIKVMTVRDTLEIAPNGSAVHATTAGMNFQWPKPDLKMVPWRQVEPKVDEEERVEKSAFNAEYLARLQKVQAAAGSRGCVFHTPAPDLSPMLVTTHGNDGSWRMTFMPMRM